MPRRLRIVAVVGFGVALVLACCRLDWREIGEALGGARLAPTALAIAVNVLARTAVRARRTQLLVGERVSFGALVRMHLAGYAAGTLLPGPAEEVVCCTHLAKQRGFAVRELVRLQVVDKGLGVLSTAIIAVALLPVAAAVPVAALSAIAIVITLPRLSALVGWLVVSNVLCIAMIALCFAAVGADLTPLGWIEVFLATAVTGALSVLPGQLGTLESTFALVAAQHGVPASLAIAAALLYRLTYAPTAIAGLPALWRISADRPACQLPDAA